MTDRKPYPTDMTDCQWAILKPLITAPKLGGRRRSVNLRESFNSLWNSCLKN
ncbi:MAG: transposase [Microcystaceae cyanobacterium]